MFITLLFIYELKLGLGSSGKNNSSVLNVDRNDLFLITEFRIQRKLNWQQFFNLYRHYSKSLTLSQVNSPQVLQRSSEARKCTKKCKKSHAWQSFYVLLEFNSLVHTIWWDVIPYPLFHPPYFVYLLVFFTQVSCMSPSRKKRKIFQKLPGMISEFSFLVFA